METAYAILIPAYNAAQYLPELIQRIRNIEPHIPIVLVNDGSVDSTEDVAKKLGLIVLSHSVNKGKGAALKTVFEYVVSIPSIQYVFTLDADLQHAPEDIPNFLRVAETTGADIVVGSRSIIGSNMPIHRRVSNYLTSWLVSSRTGVKIPDSQCGYRLIRTNLLTKNPYQSCGYEAETEFLLHAVLKGYSVAFAPIQTIYKNEKSYMKNWKTTVNFIKVLLKAYV